MLYCSGVAVLHCSSVALTITVQHCMLHCYVITLQHCYSATSQYLNAKVILMYIYILQLQILASYRVLTV